MKILEKRYASPYPHILFTPENQPSRLPLICITPLLGRLILFEDLFWEKHFARYFAKRGFAAVVMDRIIFGYDAAQPLDQISHYLKASVIKNLSNLTAVLESNHRLDPHQVGTFGISFGSIVNCLWSAADKRIKANLFGLAGADIPSICTTSRDPLMKSIMQKALSSTRLTPREFEEKLRPLLKLDPLFQGEKIRHLPTLMIQARWDCVIPARNGELFRKALGYPETIHLPCGHYLSVLAAPLLKHKMLKFFKDHLCSLSS